MLQQPLTPLVAIVSLPNIVHSIAKLLQAQTENDFYPSPCMQLLYRACHPFSTSLVKMLTRQLMKTAVVVLCMVMVVTSFVKNCMVHILATSRLRDAEGQGHVEHVSLYQCRP